jgi:SAM-dependent methyltransferase
MLMPRFFYHQFRSLFFDPRQIVNNWRGLPYFALNALKYVRFNRNQAFRIRLRDLLCCSSDRFQSAGAAKGHYFWQDLWAARVLYVNNIRTHVDVASRVDGFVAHILPFCHVVYVDLRPLRSEVEGLEFRQGSLLSLPFADHSVSSLSCLHVLEHVGLGRYGDAVDPQGFHKAAQELVRVLAPGGMLLLGTPVGRERLCFDAHRIFDPQTVLDACAPLRLVEFSLIDDAAHGVFHGASFDQARRCRYGCGLFLLKNEPSI